MVADDLVPYGHQTVLEIPTGLPVRGRQLWRRTGIFFLIFIQFYVYDLRFKAWGPTTSWLSFKHWHQAISNHHTDINWPEGVTMAQQSYCTLKHHAMVIKQTILVRYEVSNPLVYLLRKGSSSHDDNTYCNIDPISWTMFMLCCCLVLVHFTHILQHYSLTHCGLVMPNGGIDLGQHWLR